MNDQKHFVKILIWLLLTAAIAAGCFFLGRNIENKAMSAAFQAEQELNIRINRSELEGLGEIEGPVYVTGHMSPDTDTVCSSIAYAELLRKLGYDAQAVVPGPVNHETAYVLESAGLPVPPLLEDASGKTMILVDHSELTQTADGMKDAHIISIIDHHGDGSVTTANQMIYDARPLGSTATIVWIRYRNYGIIPEPQIAEIMMAALLSDTSNFKARTTSADREALKVLSGLAGVENTDEFYQEMFKASLSYEGMSDEEIFFSDYKEFESGGVKFSIGCVNAYDQDAAAALAERMMSVQPELLSLTGMDMSFAQISIFHDDLSFAYIVPSGQQAAEVIEAAFGDKGVFDGTSYVFNPGMSRRTVLVPAIADVLASHPSE